LLAGEDVAFGGVFRSTMGLESEYSRERVFVSVPGETPCRLV